MLTVTRSLEATRHLNGNLPREISVTDGMLMKKQQRQRPSTAVVRRDPLRPARNYYNTSS